MTTVSASQVSGTKGVRHWFSLFFISMLIVQNSGFLEFLSTQFFVQVSPWDHCSLCPALITKDFVSNQKQRDGQVSPTHMKMLQRGSKMERGSRQHELHKSKILLRHWSHTWQK
jgi:hypothetical protein